MYRRSAILQCLGRVFICIYNVMIDKPSTDRVWEDTIVKGGMRVAAVGGTKKLELILAQFGLNEKENDGQDDAQQPGLNRLRFDEYQREPALDRDGDDGIPDEEPDFTKLLQREETSEDDLGVDAISDDELKWADDEERGQIVEDDSSFGSSGISISGRSEESGLEGMADSDSDWTIEESFSGSSTSSGSGPRTKV